MVKIDDTIKKYLENSFVALATSDQANSPNIICVEVNKVIDNKILITDNFFNKTRSNLLINSRVSLAYWSSDGTVGYQIKGAAEYFTEGEYKELVAKLNPNYSHKGYILVTVSEIWDLANPKLLSKS